MTEPERPAGAPSGSPTPEEISARLEALLKRTHALRAERAASPPLSVTWPPPDRELDHYDVVDVSEEIRTPPPAPPTPAAVPAASAEPPQSFARPDWSELRLRTPPAEPPPRPSWLGVLTAVLALVALAQGAYIWYGQATAPVVEQGRLRVDGPEGADVRVDGQPVGTAPVDQDLPSGVYDIEVRVGGVPLRAPQVPIGLGRTVVLVPLTAPVAAAAPSAPDAGASNAAAATGPISGSPSDPAADAASVSATTGAVRIESTPPGLPVTMGGRPRGVTPITLGQLKPGRHDVLVGGSARQVDVRAGEVSTLRVPR